MREREHYSLDVLPHQLLFCLLISRWVKNNILIFRYFLATPSRFLSLFVLGKMGCWQRGRKRSKQTVFGLKVQPSRQNTSQCLLIMGIKDSSDFAEDWEGRKACPNTHAFIQKKKVPQTRFLLAPVSPATFSLIRSPPLFFMCLSDSYSSVLLLPVLLSK